MLVVQPLTALRPQFCKPSLLGLDTLSVGMQETTHFLATVPNALADYVSCSPQPGSLCAQTGPRAWQLTGLVKRALRQQGHSAQGTGQGAYKL